MEQRLEVGIYGSSLVLNGIEASLKSQKGLRVRRLSIPLAEAAWEIKMLSPHAVLFEMRDAGEPVIAAILRDHPGMKLIGIEPERDSITVFSASERPVFSMEDLEQAIIGNGRAGKDVCEEEQVAKKSAEIEGQP